MRKICSKEADDGNDKNKKKKAPQNEGRQNNAGGNDDLFASDSVYSGISDSLCDFGFFLVGHGAEYGTSAVMAN